MRMRVLCQQKHTCLRVANPHTKAMSIIDPCLQHAHAQWHSHLEQGIVLYEASNPQAAIAPLAEAIRISASFHPLFHFLESGLNTELAQHYLQQSIWDKAEAAFSRAIFLHHDNATALAGKQLAQTQAADTLPRYDTLSLSAPLKPASPTETGIHAWRKLARAAEDKTPLYLAAIEHCEAAHLRYHQLAALPWLARARCFAAMGEDSLARNDIRHGMDLDRHNPEFLALSVKLAG